MALADSARWSQSRARAGDPGLAPDKVLPSIAETSTGAPCAAGARIAADASARAVPPRHGCHLPRRPPASQQEPRCPAPPAASSASRAAPGNPAGSRQLPCQTIYSMYCLCRPHTETTARRALAVTVFPWISGPGEGISGERPR